MHHTALPWFPLMVNYGKKIDELLKQGKFDWVSPWINPHNFPIIGSEGERSIRVTLVHPNTIIETEAVIDIMDELKLRPLNIQELITFGTKYPNIQRRLLIAGLGTIWTAPMKNMPLVSPCLASEQKHPRKLILCWIEDFWGKEWHFAATPKEKTKPVRKKTHGFF